MPVPQLFTDILYFRQQNKEWILEWGLSSLKNHLANSAISTYKGGCTHFSDTFFLSSNLCHCQKTPDICIFLLYPKDSYACSYSLHSLYVRISDPPSTIEFRGRNVLGHLTPSVEKCVIFSKRLVNSLCTYFVSVKVKIEGLTQIEWCCRWRRNEMFFVYVLGACFV